MLSNIGLALVLASFCHGLSRYSGQIACNNSPSLCEKPYSSITHLGAHDSPFVSNSSNSYSLAGNQYYDSISQLGAGVRLLQAQIHDQSGGLGTDIRLCHTSCALYDAGPLSTWLTGISTWMDSNPSEIVTILLVNSDNNDAVQLDSVFDYSGIKKYAYTLSGSGTWPTLTEMITLNTRLVTFVANLADNTAAPYLLDEFTYVFENPYSVMSANNFTCLPDRPTTLDGSAIKALDSGRLFLMNHFLDAQLADGIELPDKNNAPNTNSPNTAVVGSLGFEMQKCNVEYSHPPNFVLVDWFDVGPAISSVDLWNGVTDPVGRISVDSINQASGTAAVAPTSPGALYASITAASPSSGTAQSVKTAGSNSLDSSLVNTLVIILAFGTFIFGML